MFITCNNCGAPREDERCRYCGFLHNACSLTRELLLEPSKAQKTTQLEMLKHLPALINTVTGREVFDEEDVLLQMARML